MDLFKGLIDAKLLSILKLFLDNPSEYYHINKISKDAKVPLATTFRLVNKLLDHKIIEYHQISKFKIYKLAKNNKTKKLRRIIWVKNYR